MRSSSLISHDGYGVQETETFDPWDVASQYAPTPGKFGRLTASPSDKSCTNIDPISLVDYASPQHNASQKNSLPLLQFGDWEEGRTYDENPPTSIHYLTT